MTVLGLAVFLVDGVRDGGVAGDAGASVRLPGDPGPVSDRGGGDHRRGRRGARRQPSQDGRRHVAVGVQSYDMVRGQADIPLVPLVVNTAAPPLPSMGRCAALGRALGAAVRACDAGRVLVIASGGLSHWLPSNDPRDTAVPAERRAAMIHGRRDVRAASDARESRVRELGGNPDAPVNAAWDAWFLKQLVAADLDPVTELGDEALEERAGSGSHEIRSWLIGFAAAARPLLWTSYEPVPEWITGMGIGTTFQVV
jgi:2,3-dihydroxyphenylpropionate 1,2-dioxygenase